MAIKWQTELSTYSSFHSRVLNPVRSKGICFQFPGYILPNSKVIKGTPWYELLLNRLIYRSVNVFRDSVIVAMTMLILDNTQVWVPGFSSFHYWEFGKCVFFYVCISKRRRLESWLLSGSTNQHSIQHSNVHNHWYEVSVHICSQLNNGSAFGADIMVLCWTLLYEIQTNL